MCDADLTQGSLMAICSDAPDRFYVDWVRLELPSGTIEVTAQPVRVDGADGMIVPVSARTARRIAQALGAALVTPDMLDAIWTQATVKIGPHLMPNDGSWEQSRKWSAWADDKLREQRVGPQTLVSFADKIWFYDGANLPTNYGLHVPSVDAPGGKWRGITTYPTCAQTEARVIQPIGHAHNNDHSDYSQHCRLWREVQT